MSERPILAIDTATSDVVVALGTPDGEWIDGDAWPAGHRHGEGLLPSIGRLLDAAGVHRASLGGIVVGTGPGAFTGLRVGLATGKALAHALARPLAGVPTSAALVAAVASLGHAADAVVLLLPAGPSDRVVVRPGASPAIVPAGTEPELAADDVVAAVDLAGRAPDDAVARGTAARERLGRELLRLGAPRLRDGGDDLAQLVPEYVTLPRGVASASATGEVSWSRDHR